MIDGFVIHMLLTSPYFRTQICGAFRRALTARTGEEYLLQMVEWVYEELKLMPKSLPKPG